MCMQMLIQVTAHWYLCIKAKCKTESAQKLPKQSAWKLSLREISQNIPNGQPTEQHPTPEYTQWSANWATSHPRIYPMVSQLSNIPPQNIPNGQPTEQHPTPEYTQWSANWATSHPRIYPMVSQLSNIPPQNIPNGQPTEQHPTPEYNHVWIGLITLIGLV